MFYWPDLLFAYYQDTFLRLPEVSKRRAYAQTIRPLHMDPFNYNN